MTPRQPSSNGGTADRTSGSGPCANEVETFNRKVKTMQPRYLLPLAAILLTACTTADIGSPAQPNSAAKLSFTVQPSDATAGTAIVPAVTIQDAFGNTVPTATNAVTVAIGANPGGGTLSGTTTVNASAGVATFADLRIDRPGSGYTLAASSVPLTGATSAAFTITPAPAAKLGFIEQPASTSAGVTITPAVQAVIQDAFGNTVPTATNAVTVAIGANPGGGTLSGTTTVNASAGVATFADLRIDRPGSGYTLVAASDGLTSATSVTFGIRFAFAAVSAEGNSTCGVTTGDAAYCWGNNSGGELGDGTTIDRLTPVPVSGGLDFVSVSAGGSHMCGVTTGGAAYCWGENAEGQLGDGSTTTRLSPVPVSGGMTFVAVSTGSHHTCGVTMGGTAHCWGRNSSGQLGDGTTTARLSPVPVSGGLTFAAVSARFSYTCGLTTGGAAYCWGNNSGGQLGDGTTTIRLSPVPVSGGLTFAMVSPGAAHTCGVTTGGAAFCWGDNGDGGLGDGTTMAKFSPMPVSGGLTFAMVSAGAGYTCGITAGAAAYCWGGNSSGQLGDGTTTARLSPVPVSGSIDFVAVSAASLSFHTCGVTAGGAAYCWGGNSSGELGDGTRTRRLIPVRVAQ